ncbi:hypothetical protein GCM10010967_53050 [Dyadobacter beijingensis]|uniref:Uncharacterized protein n=1 Tax=Dyadobacter beijingensis TaxID=365489 RepID=A0ABQ2IHY5_9BACT|nr:hypothetical protein GCM10010967_53050 [Dyadobacter beijingensis]
MPHSAHFKVPKMAAGVSGGVVRTFLPIGNLPDQTRGTPSDIGMAFQNDGQQPGTPRMQRLATHLAQASAD